MLVRWRRGRVRLAAASRRASAPGELVVDPGAGQFLAEVTAVHDGSPFDSGGTGSLAAGGVVVKSQAGGGHLNATSLRL